MKKFLSVLLICTVVLFNIQCVFAYEYKPYVGKDVIYSTSVEITDENDEVVKTLTAGSKIKASVRVKAAEGYSGKATLVVASYSDGFLDKVVPSSAVDIYTDKATTITTEYITVPDTKAGIKVYICNDLNQTHAKPLFAMGEFGNNTGTVSGITVGGKAVDGFSANVYEYDVTVGAGYLSWPEIVVYTDNIMTDVTVDYAGQFPLTTITRDGTVRTSKKAVANKGYAYVKVGDTTYTLNITQEAPAITDLTPTFGSGTINMGIVYNVDEPDWTTAGVTSLNLATSVNKADYAGKFRDDTLVTSSIFTRSGGYTRGILYDIAPELKGSHLLAIYDDSSVSISAVSFKVNRNVRVYLYDGNKDITKDGWIKAPDKVMYRYFTVTSETGKFRLYESGQLYYKDIDITEDVTGTYYSVAYNEETGYATVNVTSSIAKPHIFVKFAEAEPVSNIKYTSGGTTESTSAVYFGSPLLRTGITTDGTWYANGATESAGGLDEGYLPGLGSGNVMSASFVFTDKATRNNSGWFPMAVDSAVEGGMAIELPSAGVSNVEFDLNTTSDVYVITNYNASDLEGYLKGWTVVGSSDDAFVTIRTSASSTSTETFKMPKNTSYKNTYFVEEGTSEKISIQLPGGASSAVVVIKPADLK